MWQLFKVCLQLFVTLVLVIGAVGFPSGAPPSACESLMPNHGADAQNESTNPYELDLSDFLTPSKGYSYVPGATYTGGLANPNHSDLVYILSTILSLD